VVKREAGDEVSMTAATQQAVERRAEVGQDRGGEEERN